MSLQFIFGGAGSGKTYYINRRLVEAAVRNRDKNFIVIVPEQFTMETQQALVSLHPGHSVMNIDIVSFERLAYRVFEELSCMPQTVLDDAGKSMLLRKACAGVEKKLEVYRGHLDQYGFIEQLKSMMSEFGQYRIGDRELRELRLKTEKKPLLNKKIGDLQILMEAFRASLGEGMIPAEELLPSLCRVLSRSKKIRGSVIALDGFTGFTPAQYEVLEKLLFYAEKVMVTVTVDPEADPLEAKKNYDLFALSRKTAAALNRIAADTGAGREADIYLSDLPRFERSEELSFLSRQILRYPALSWKEKPKDIFVTREKTPKRECQALAEKIGRLVRKEGYRYREIAVVCGDLAGYRPNLEQAMKEAEIPCFLDDKRTLLTNPVVEYMRAALEAIEKDFSYESIFRYLKCGFCTLSPEILFELENYVLAFGIRGHGQWERDWDLVCRETEHVNLEELNRAREEAASPLLTLRQVLKTKGATVRQMTEALFFWLDGQRVDGILGKMAEGFEAAGEYSLAKEYEQAYEQLLDLFDRIVGLLGEEVLTVKTYNDVLDAGCREIRVGVVPAAMDRVLIGDVERSRFNHIRALFFIGVNDGNVPAPEKPGGLLSEMDRRELASYAELTPSRRESSLIDKFYLYLTVTKPSEKLFVSYAAGSENGEEKAPSSYLSYLFRVLPFMETREGRPVPEPEEILSRTLALQMLAEGFEEFREGKETASWDALYGCLYAEEENRRLLTRLAENAFYTYKGDRISEAVARILYGEPLKGSVTRLETYAACAYAQFLTYGLELTRRKEFEFAALDMGNVFHRAIELCFKMAGEKEISIGDLDENARHGLVERAMEAAADSLGSNILTSSSRNEYLFKRMGQITEKTIWALGEQIRAGRFEPAAFELSFAPGENSAMQISLLGGGTMQLKGKIDRVDLYEDEEQVYVKVIDYKSGSMDFDLNSVYYGLQIQLVVYLDAVMRREEKRHPDKNVVPAGMFYYQIRDPVLEREDSGKNPEAAVLGALRPRGLFNGEKEIVSLFQKEEEADGNSRWIPAVTKGGEIVKSRSSVATREQFTHMKHYVERKMQEFGTTIAAGDVCAMPYKRREKTGCDFCSFKSVCGFDRKLPGYEYKRLKELAPEDIWKEMAEKDGMSSGKNEKM